MTTDTGKATLLPSPLQAKGERVASIDVFRGLTILGMIFVNDVAGVKGAPAWMKHVPPGVDGMTFVDVVFPAFLFIVGMAIPFALGRRAAKGDSLFALLGHVSVRTLGLLVVGVFMVNMPADSAAMGMSPQVWTLLVYSGVVLAWNIYPREERARRHVWTALRLAGIALLAWCAVAYRGRADGQIVHMRTMWWGILGLIGWAYLAGSLCYILLHGQLAGMVGMIGVFTAMFIAKRTGGFDALGPVNAYLDLGSQIGGHGSIVASGIVAGMLFFPGSPAPAPGVRMRWMLAFGAGLAAAGFLLKPLYGISKNDATPAWCLLSAAWCCLVFVAVYGVMDIRGFTSWARFLKPAGENPLLAYVLPSIFYAVCGLLHLTPLTYHPQAALPGIARSLVFTAAMLALTALLGRLRIRLRL